MKQPAILLLVSRGGFDLGCRIGRSPDNGPLEGKVLQKMETDGFPFLFLTLDRHGQSLL